MQDQIDLIQQIYELIVNFVVSYSFQLLGAVLVLILGFVVGGWVSRALLRVQEKRNVDVTLRLLIASTVRILVVGLFLIVALSQMGISITPLIAAIGGLALGASFAIQGPVSNYGAGLVIILTRTYKVGDTLTVQGCSGLVEQITLATTLLRAEDGEQIIIPNKHIVGEIHRNSQANRVVEGQVGITYGTDPVHAIQVIRDALKDIDGIAHDPAPQVGINAFADSSVVLDYRIWVSTNRYFELLHAANLAVYKTLRQHDVPIPVLQRELRMLNAS